jgi:protein TonB
MSYHAQQNTQEKSVGMFVVFAFHVLLVWAIANGLGVTISKPPLPEPTKYFKDPTPVIPVTLPKPSDPSIKDPTIVITQTPPIIDTFTENPIQPPVIFTTDNGPIGGTSIQPTITKPTIRKATKPEYPSASTRLGEEGTTGLQLYIAADGRVTDAQVFKSSGSLRLDTAAVKHVIRSWAFNPCTEDGKAVACSYRTNLTWKLEDAAR